MGPSTLDDDLRSLGQLLWRYREHLEHVEFLLDVEHLLVTAGRDRWLARTADQLKAAAEDVAALDHERSHLLGQLALSLGRPGPLTLRQVVDAAPTPWGDIFADHLTWFTQEVRRISDAALQARSSLEGGLDRVQDVLRTLGGTGGSGYDHAGRAVASRTGNALFFDNRA